MWTGLPCCGLGCGGHVWRRCGVVVDVEQLGGGVQVHYPLFLGEFNMVVGILEVSCGSSVQWSEHSPWMIKSRNASNGTKETTDSCATSASTGCSCGESSRGGKRVRMIECAYGEWGKRRRVMSLLPKTMTSDEDVPCNQVCKY